MRTWMVVALVVALLGGAAEARKMTSKGIIGPLYQGKAAARVRGDIDVGFLTAFFDASFRCRGKACLFRRGFFEATCIVGGGAFGRIIDRAYPPVRCEWEGTCENATWLGEYVCPDGRTGAVSLRNLPSKR